MPLTTELNLFLERCRGFTIGVTGSVGKSTTTMLIYLAVRAALGAGREGGGGVFLGGILGGRCWGICQGSACEALWCWKYRVLCWRTRRRLAGRRMWRCTNVYPNHLDRHGTMAEYAAAKQNLLRFQGAEDVAILNGDHELVKRWGDLANAA